MKGLKLLALLFSIVSVVSGKNMSSSASAEIPIKVILRDVRNGEDNSSPAPDLKRTLVGVKRHKNYEIVLYEYSDEEDVKDEEFPGNGSNETAGNSGVGVSSTELPEILSLLPEILNATTIHSIFNVTETPLPIVESGSGRKKAYSDDTGEEDETSKEDTPFLWSPQEAPEPPKPSPTPGRIALKEKKIPSSSAPPPEKWEEEEVFSGPSSTTRRPGHYRQSIEDAPGAGRFVPRRRQQKKEESENTESLNDSADNPDNETDKQENDDEGEEKEKLCKDPTGKDGICEEYYRCSAIYTVTTGKINLQEYKCPLGEDRVGICCPIFHPETDRGRQQKMKQMAVNRKKLAKPLTPQIRKLVRSIVNNSIAFGLDSVLQLDEIEAELLDKKPGTVLVGKETPAFSHNRFFPSSKKIRQVSEFGFELLQTTNDLSDRLQLSDDLGGLGLKGFRASNTEAISDRCPILPPCGINKYRLIDGSCNNLRKPKMGQSLTPLSRVLEPDYADGRWEPRISVRGFLLPSARFLSQRFIRDRDNPNSKYALMTMQLGQFVDHDISSVPIFTFQNGSGISCCRNGNFLPPTDRHPNCLPIEIPGDDPFYSRFGQRCMNFVRSRMAPRIDCSLGYADQMNAVTHWLDLSNVYGSSETEMRDLRGFSDGLMQFSELADRRALLPLKRTRTGDVDYKAGDERVNEMQGLMVMHLIWLREHNRVASELQRINPYWNDEQLFQEARRIVIAEYQHIIYNEWLPIVVGREYMESYGILPLSRRRFFQGYDPEIDASIETAFSAAGFRMGHSLVQGIVRLINEFGQQDESILISNHAENAQRTRAPNQVDKWIRGLAGQPMQNFDPFVTQHLNGRLFQARGGLFGMDLSALNIQRGRDHGVPGYNMFRELCQTGKRARSFDDFTDWISPNIVDEMKRIYDHPDDVDLWIGGISETPLKGALVGPTFTCLIGDQFARTKKGDRYFYDVGDQAHSFSGEQLMEIRKSSMARILCDNSDELEAIQPATFLLSDFDFNTLVDCRSRRIPRVNLRLWENEPTP